MLSANFEFLSRNWRFSTILQLPVQPLQSVAPQLGGGGAGMGWGGGGSARLRGVSGGNSPPTHLPATP